MATCTVHQIYSIQQDNLVGGEGENKTPTQEECTIQSSLWPSFLSYLGIVSL